MRAEVFLDTAYAIALSSPNDRFHRPAVQDLGSDLGSGLASKHQKASGKPEILQ